MARGRAYRGTETRWTFPPRNVRPVSVRSKALKTGKMRDPAARSGKI